MALEASLENVAPRVGAWIETCIIYLGGVGVLSHPVWVRGLKLPRPRKYSLTLAVAPRVGAWIETKYDIKVKELVEGRTPCGCVD